MEARAIAPMRRGTKMVLMRDCSNGFGAMRTAPPAAPRTADSMNGIVNMPSRLEPTVSSSASAVLPPTACQPQSLR